MKPEELNEGQVCFILGYEDKDFRIPYIQTLVFTGRDVLEIEGRETDVWCFENPRETPRSATGAAAVDRQAASTCCIAETELDSVVDLEGLIEELRGLQTRRNMT